MKKVYNNKIKQQVFENCITCLIYGIYKSDINRLGLSQHEFDCIYDRVKFRFKNNK